jgi:hypothetical protein
MTMMMTSSIKRKKKAPKPNWKIAVPESMVVDTVKWFYQVMGHPGEKDYKRS